MGSINASKILGLEEALQSAIEEAKQYAEKSTWNTVVKYAKDLEQYLRQQLVEFYEQIPTSEYYDRTYEFANSLYVKPTQGRGSYGVHILFDQGGIKVHIMPKGKFNAHASYWGEPIDVNELAFIEDGKLRGALFTFLAAKALDFTNANFGKKLKISTLSEIMPDEEYYYDY